MTQRGANTTVVWSTDVVSTVSGTTETGAGGGKTTPRTVAAVVPGYTTISTVGLPLTPSLIGTHPVLLEALRGTTSAMATGGAFARVGQASLLLVVLAPIPTLFFVVPFFWWAGRLWGPAAAAPQAGGNPKAALIRWFANCALDQKCVILGFSQGRGR